MSRLVFVDTWGWLALGHRADAHHEAVKEVFRTRQAEPALLHTSDYVLDELIHAAVSPGIARSSLPVPGWVARGSGRRTVAHPPGDGRAISRRAGTAPPISRQALDLIHGPEFDVDHDRVGHPLIHA